MPQPLGSGKATLALMLIDRGAELVGDDGIEIERRGDTVWAHPPETIRGQMEIRGVGIVTLPAVSAPLSLVIEFDPAAPRLPEPRSRGILDLALPLLAFRPEGQALALRAERALRLLGI